MKHILDSSFRYKPSFDTDVRRTFKRIREQMKPKPEPSPKDPANTGRVIKLLKVA